MLKDALFQLGMDSARLNTAQTEQEDKTVLQERDRPDHFIEKDGVVCAGAHLIVDLYEAKRLDDLPYIRRTLIDCVEAAGATLLHIHLHPFEPNGGVSGVAVLAESHISIHSWPERGYAALDIFMCGDAEPDRCIDVLKNAFHPGRMEVKELLRGESV
ncbi:adenosylmethionine decarboxylase [Chelativorans sp. Marseille-P2723]|uniref:adenosylmethionine decarboxylase n=1 Tax=Chelativorans sp. Marseille-P2723 TaxID=2709133 RepID=UPI00156DD17F|nr:adenosylmethionine decarboxylase [Chelativorans sp. Marseille-P2723]